MADDYETGFRDGYTQALTHAAQRIDELDYIWQPIKRPTYEQVVAARIEAMRGRTPPATLRFDDPNWPPVLVPGGGGLRIGPTGVFEATGERSA